MKRILILTLIFNFIISICYSYDLFINSDTINASVFINGEDIGKTPLRIKDYNNNMVDIKIMKEGFIEIKDKVLLEEEKPNLLFYNLTSKNIDIVIDHKDKDIYINNIKVGKGPVVLKDLKDGLYQFKNIDGNIYISESHYEKIKRTAQLETLYSSGFLLASIIGRLHFNSSDQIANAHAMNISSIIFGGILGYNLAKLYKIDNLIKTDRYSKGIIDIKPVKKEADREIFLKGMDLLGKELWKEALVRFNLIINLYPDSRYFPLSVYEMGYCFYKMNNYEKAVKWFRNFVYNYPVYELYSYAICYLIDLDLKTGNPDYALNDYNKVNPVYLEDESGELYKQYDRVLRMVYLETEEKYKYILEDLLKAINIFLKYNKGSLAYPEVYFLKGKLLYEYLDREKGLKIFREIKENYYYYKDIITEMDSILNE